MTRLSGRTAIVTGAASGIGQASAVLFAREGAHVVAVDRNEDGVRDTVAAISRLGGTALAVVADVTDETAVSSYVNSAIQRFGGVDIMFSNAGISLPPLPFWEQSLSDWKRLFDINLFSSFLAIKHCAAPMMERRKGAIILTASVAGLRANASGAAYSASKAGVISLVQTAADAFAGTGVRINAICPGLIETGMTRKTFEKARERGTEDRIGQLNPMRRAGQPEEIATTALFLASDEASYVNGQAIAVDGGLSSTHPFIPKKAGA